MIVKLHKPPKRNKITLIGASTLECKHIACHAWIAKLHPRYLQPQIHKLRANIVGDTLSHTMQIYTNMTEEVRLQPLPYNNQS
jgi:hypothetical protein